MSRAFGGRSLTTLPPTRTVPLVISSSPAIIRSALVFRQALWHPIEVTLISQAIVVVCAGLIAHALVHAFRGRWFLRFLILLPWAAPISLTVIGFLWFFDPQASIWNWFLIKLGIVD